MRLRGVIGGSAISCACVLRSTGAFAAPVALGTADLPVPRSFGPASLQAYVTRAVAERGAAGPDTCGWLRFVVPVDTGARTALPSRLVDR